VLDKVKLAISKKYEMVHIYEIWEYETTQYDLITKSGGLFAEYVNRFAAIKEHASGLPPNVATIDEVDQFIKLFHEKEGIKLEKNLFQHNPGLRFIAKLLLNSLWGRFGMKENRPQTSVVKTKDELDGLILDDTLEVNRIVDGSEDIYYVAWAKREEEYNPNPAVNVVVAAYTTAFARMRLYSIIDKLQERVLYMDTG